MTQKSYSKQSEYRTYSTKGAYDDGDFDSMKAELLPSKYGSLVQSGNGAPPGNKEFYYEYREEKNPAGTYDRKDLRTVEQYDYTGSPRNIQNSYADSGRLAITAGPQKVTTTTTTTTTNNKDLSHNIEELDSLLDDLQKDQERKLYKSGYTSDTMESSSFDYRSPTSPVKTSGYSTLNKVERDTEWIPSPAPSQTISREVNREIVRNVTESRVIPGQVPYSPQQNVPAVLCTNCHGHPNTTQQVSGTPMNKVTTTVKTYTYEVPADQDPTTLPIPGTTPPKTVGTTTNTTVSEKYLTNDRNYVNDNQEHRTYVNTQFNTSTPIGSPVRATPSPQPNCQYCSHCNSCITTTNTTTTNLVGGVPPPHHVHHHPSPDTNRVTTRTQYTTNTTNYPGGQQPPASPPYAIPVDHSPRDDYPPNQRRPVGLTSYEYTSTNYTNRSNTDGPGGQPGAFPNSPSPFPRTESPAPRNQEPPKRLNDLLADFPGHENYPTDNDGMRRRPNPARGPGGSINGPVSVRETASMQQQANKAQSPVATSPSLNIAGPAVYYPPGHEMFARKDESAAYQQAGGGYRKGKGKYMYEAESSSKSKSSSGGAVVPVCLPLCCAMPCVLL